MFEQKIFLTILNCKKTFSIIIQYMQDDIQNNFSTVMFRGTLLIDYCQLKTRYNPISTELIISINKIVN